MGTKFITENLLVSSDATIGGEVIGSKEVIMFNASDPTSILLGQTNNSVVLTRAGSITGYTLLINISSTTMVSGSFEIEINESPVWVLALGTLNLLTNKFSDTQPRDTDNFVAGDRLRVTLPSISFFTNAIILVEIMYDD